MIKKDAVIIQLNNELKSLIIEKSGQYINICIFIIFIMEIIELKTEIKGHIIIKFTL
jgi:hypothetical protein